MPATGQSVFFLPVASYNATEPSKLQVIIDRIEAQFQLRFLPRWSLEHRLFRETSSESVKAHETRYLQVLHLSHHPNYSYLAITTTHASSGIGTPATSNSGSEINGEHATIVAIPSGSQTEDFVQVLFSRFSPLWTQRQVLQVINGQAFEAGDFRVRLGELKQGQGSSQQSKGMIAELEWMAGSENDRASAESVVKEFWKGLEIRGAKEYMRGLGTSTGLNTIGQWYEALRTR